MAKRPSGKDLLDALEAGRVRAAQPTADGWVVHAWVKQGILDIFRTSPVVPQGIEGEPLAGEPGAFRDKRDLGVRRFDDTSDVRIVPGGSAVRRGAYLGPGVVCMPPMYVNVGAWVGPRSMIDSHALVGTCAQIGEGVHISAGAQIGGVLEPPGAMPVIVEDGAFVGGQVGLYEGVRVGRMAVLGAGVILSATTPVYDLVHECVLRGTPEQPLVIPERAVVVSGTRPARGVFATRHGLGQAAALIVKLRDERTEARAALEDVLRPS